MGSSRRNGYSVFTSSSHEYAYINFVFFSNVIPKCVTHDFNALEAILEHNCILLMLTALGSFLDRDSCSRAWLTSCLAKISPFSERACNAQLLHVISLSLCQTVLKAPSNIFFRDFEDPSISLKWRDKFLGLEKLGPWSWLITDVWDLAVQQWEARSGGSGAYLVHHCMRALRLQKLVLWPEKNSFRKKLFKMLHPKSLLHLRIKTMLLLPTASWINSTDPEGPDSVSKPQTVKPLCSCCCDDTILQGWLGDSRWLWKIDYVKSPTRCRIFMGESDVWAIPYPKKQSRPSLCDPLKL